MDVLADLLEAIAAHLAAWPDWDTPPSADWFPDWDRQDLQTGGKTGLILPLDWLNELERRHRGGVVPGDIGVHIAVVQPMAEPATNWAAGKANVAIAEKVLGLVGTRLGPCICIDAELSPAVSRDAAKQYRLFVSYVKTSWRK